MQYAKHLIFPGFEYGKRVKSNRGLGDYGTCEKCNNDLGSYYSKNYKELVDGFSVKGFNSNSTFVEFELKICPLNVLKQIIIHHLCADRELGMLRELESIKNFIVDKYDKNLTDRLKLFMYATNSNIHRFFGITFNNDFQSKKIRTLSEFNFHPFGFVLTLDSEPPRDDFIEITHFKNFDFDESKLIKFSLPIIQISTLSCGYYP